MNEPPAAALRIKKDSSMRVAVNLSVHQLRRPELPGHIDGDQPEGGLVHEDPDAVGVGEIGPAGGLRKWTGTCGFMFFGPGPRGSPKAIRGRISLILVGSKRPLPPKKHTATLSRGFWGGRGPLGGPGVLSLERRT